MVYDENIISREKLLKEIYNNALRVELWAEEIKYGNIDSVYSKENYIKLKRILEIIRDYKNE